jgi:Autotransporter beta-domain
MPPHGSPNTLLARHFKLLLQGTGYEGSAVTQFANLPLTDSDFVSSLEVGYPIPLPWLGPHFVLEPQGQIIGQLVSFKGANDGLGPVGLGTTGRLGLRGQWTITGANGMVWQPYVRANVWHDWAPRRRRPLASTKCL